MKNDTKQFIYFLDGFTGLKIIRYGEGGNASDSFKGLTLKYFPKDPRQIEKLKMTNVICTTLVGSLNLLNR